MFVRRVFYWAQLAAVVVLPTWIMVARALSVDGLGAQDILVYLSWPALAVSMIVVLGITWSRAAVRRARAVSWIDVAALSVWFGTAVAYGAFIAASSELGAGLTGGLLALVSVAVIGLAAWQLVAAARRRVKEVFASLDSSAVPIGEYAATPFRPGDGPVIRIEPSDR